MDIMPVVRYFKTRNLSDARNSCAAIRHDPDWFSYFLELAVNNMYLGDTMQKNFICGMLTLLVTVATGAALAQEFPSKPLRIISPNATGFAPDIALRIVAEAIGKGLGQPVVVEARPGANGFIALEAAKRAAADGYTLVAAGQPQLAVIPKLFKKVPYEAEDFAPLSTIYSAPFYLAVNVNASYKSVRDLIAAARANPGKLTYSSPYVGSPPHMGGALLAFGTGTQMLHIPYKEAVQVYSAVGTGDVDLALGTIGSVSPMLKAGRVRLLAIAARSRASSYPEVPTVEESGGPAGFQIDVWNALLVPRGTPPAIIARLNAAIVAALRLPDIQQRYRQSGLEPVSSTPAAITEMIQGDQRIYGELIARTGIAAE